MQSCDGDTTTSDAVRLRRGSTTGPAGGLPMPWAGKNIGRRRSCGAVTPNEASGFVTRSKVTGATWNVCPPWGIIASRRVYPSFGSAVRRRAPHGQRLLVEVEAQQPGRGPCPLQQSVGAEARGQARREALFQVVAQDPLGRQHRGRSHGQLRDAQAEPGAAVVLDGGEARLRERARGRLPAARGDDGASTGTAPGVGIGAEGGDGAAGGGEGRGASGEGEGGREGGESKRSHAIALSQARRPRVSNVRRHAAGAFAGRRRPLGTRRVDTSTEAARSCIRGANIGAVRYDAAMPEPTVTPFGATVYLAAEGYDAELRAELGPGAAPLVEGGRLFALAGPPRPAAWAANVWRDPVRVRFDTPADAARVLARDGQELGADAGHPLPAHGPPRAARPLHRRQAPPLPLPSPAPVRRVDPRRARHPRRLRPLLEPLPRTARSASSRTTRTRRAAPTSSSGKRSPSPAAAPSPARAAWTSGAARAGGPGRWSASARA